MQVLIIEDEKKHQDQLILLFNKLYPDHELLAPVSSVSEAVESILIHKPDLVISDIEINGGSTFDVFEKLNTINFPIIFVTAYNDYAVRAFKLHAIHYLLKPLDTLEFQSAIERVINLKEDFSIKESLKKVILELRQANGTEDRFSVATLSGFDLISFSDVVWCKAHRAYSEFYLINGQNVLSSKPIKEYVSKLEEHGFIRVHKSHVVNLKYIKSYNKLTHTVHTLNGDSIAVARRRKDDLLALLKD